MAMPHGGRSRTKASRLGGTGKGVKSYYTNVNLIISIQK